MFLMVATWSPEPFPANPPATPTAHTWVVETGRPNTSAAPMVAAAGSTPPAQQTRDEVIRQRFARWHAEQGARVERRQ